MTFLVVLLKMVVVFFIAKPSRGQIWGMMNKVPSMPGSGSPSMGQMSDKMNKVSSLPESGTLSRGEISDMMNKVSKLSGSGTLSRGEISDMMNKVSKLSGSSLSTNDANSFCCDNGGLLGKIPKVDEGFMSEFKQKLWEILSSVFLPNYIQKGLESQKALSETLGSMSKFPIS